MKERERLGIEWVTSHILAEGKHDNNFVDVDRTNILYLEDRANMRVGVARISYS